MSQKLSSGFEIAAFSDLDYEGMSVEIRFRGIPVAELNKEGGLDRCELVVPSRFSPAEATFALPLDAFIDALSEAKSLIAQL